MLDLREFCESIKAPLGKDASRFGHVYLDVLPLASSQDEELCV